MQIADSLDDQLRLNPGKSIIHLPLERCKPHPAKNSESFVPKINKSANASSFPGYTMRNMGELIIPHPLERLSAVKHLTSCVIDQFPWHCSSEMLISFWGTLNVGASG
jgi:hypothetical protein